MRMLWNRREFRYVALGLGFQTYVATTVLSWSAPFYTRVHDLELSHAAVALGLLTGIGGACGSFLGGALGDRFGCRNQRWYLWVPAMACAITALAGMCQYLVSHAMLSLVFAFATMIMVSGFVPPVYAIAQSLVAPNMRALTSAVLVMSSALLGGAFGPTVTGSLSDYLSHAFDAGPHSLQIAICLGFLFSVGAAWSFYRAGYELRAAPPEEI
jgi:MFS family permease